MKDLIEVLTDGYGFEVSIDGSITRRSAPHRMMCVKKKVLSDVWEVYVNDIGRCEWKMIEADSFEIEKNGTIRLYYDGDYVGWIAKMEEKQ